MYHERFRSQNVAQTIQNDRKEGNRVTRVRKEGRKEGRKENQTRQTEQFKLQIGKTGQRACT